MDPVSYTVLVHDEGPDGLWAEVEELPGCFASGATLPELWAGVSEAVSLYLSTPGNPVDARLTELDEHPSRREVIEEHRVALHV